MAAMATTETYTYGSLAFLLGTDVASPVFAAICGFTEFTQTFGTNTTDTVLPDCTNPDLPSASVADITSLTRTVSLTGVLSRAGKPLLDTWFDSAKERQVKIMTRSNNLSNGTFAGKQYPAVLTSLEYGSTSGGRATVSITVTLNGAGTTV